MSRKYYCRTEYDFFKYLRLCGDIVNQNFESLLKKYYTARIDIKNRGNDNDIEILEINDSNSKIYRPDWFKDSLGSGINVHSFNGTLDLKIKCIKDGELKIELRGLDVRDKNGKRFPVYIDYTNFSINNDSIINSNKLTWHDQAYVFSKSVKDSEIVDIHVEWMPFNFFSEFKVDESPDLIQSLREKLSLLENKIKSIPELCYTSLGYSALGGKVTYRNWRVFPNSLLDDLNGYCDNIWFTRYLKHKFPDEDFNINMFSVFGRHDNLAYPMEGKKVLYSMEDLEHRFLEMKYRFDKYALDYVDLALGYDVFDHPKYSRFPYWILDHFSPESTEEDIEKKVDYWNSVSHEKSKDVTIITRHDLFGTRTMIANDVSKYTSILYAGNWKNNTSEMFIKYHNNKFDYLNQFKFYLCPENLLADAYVTEKVFDAFYCDCIPLYAGGGNYLEPKIINHNAIIRWDGEKILGSDPTICERVHYGYAKHLPVTWVADDDRNSDSIELFKNLLTDKKSYDEFKDQDKILPSGKKQIIKIFSDLEKHFERLVYS